tara:strand:+ start:231 stop:602 length:372 start_codon:yes stop_codon:yes gene_type:complete
MQLNTPKVSVKDKKYRTSEITEELILEDLKQATELINDAYVAQVSVGAEPTDTFNQRVEEAEEVLTNFRDMTREFEDINTFKGDIRMKAWRDGGCTLSIHQGQPMSFSLDVLRSALESSTHSS